MKKSTGSINLTRCFFCLFSLCFFSPGSTAYSAPSAYYDTVQKIYIGYYQRPADPAGLLYWAEALDKGSGDLAAIIEAFANSEEARALYGSIDGSSIVAVVNGIYHALFGRDAETAGLEYFVNGFNAGQFTAATIMLNVLYGAQNEDLQSVNNKLTAADLFTRSIDPELDGSNFLAAYQGEGDAIAGRNFLTLFATSMRVPTQAETTLYLQTHIADAGDPILISREEAAQIVLDGVIGNGDGQTIIARLWPVPLSSGDIVSGEFADTGEGRVSTGSEWLVWIDDHPYAFFSHSVRYAYVNAATGAAAVEEAYEAPALNGNLLWETEEDLADAAFIIFDNTTDFLYESALAGSRSMRAAGGGLTAASVVRTAVGSAGRSMKVQNEADPCCEGKGERIALILYNFDNGPLRNDIEQNVIGVAAALQKHSFTVPQFVSSTGDGKIHPAIYLGDNKGTGLQQLRDFVTEHSGADHCCDEIFIYYTGHGKEQTVGGQKRYAMGARFNYKGEDGKRSGQRRIYAEDLAEILTGLGSCYIQVVLDACHSGGFVNALSGVKGIQTIQASAGADELAYSGYYDAVQKGKATIADPYGRAQGEKGSEFTSGFVKGLEDSAATKGDRTIPAGELAQIGFSAAVANDVAAISGKTHPGFTQTANACDCCGDDDPGGGGPADAPGADVEEVVVRFAITTGAVTYQPLPKDNTVLHSNGVNTVAAAGATDMTGVGSAKITLSESLYGDLFGSTDFPCGEGAYGLTLCPAGLLKKTGSYYLVSAEFVDDMPHADAEFRYQIGFVFDSDGNSSNNYQPAPAWPADFFANTDRWYVAEYAPASGWKMSVIHAVTSTPVASGARIIINGKAFVLVLPASEIPASQASFRITAFRHDGSYGLNGGFWNADLSTAVGQPMLNLP